MCKGGGGKSKADSRASRIENRRGNHLEKKSPSDGGSIGQSGCAAGMGVGGAYSAARPKCACSQRQAMGKSPDSIKHALLPAIKDGKQQQTQSQQPGHRAQPASHLYRKASL